MGGVFGTAPAVSNRGGVGRKKITFFLKKTVDFSLVLVHTISMKDKDNTYTVYHQYSLDAEFTGTREECEAWIADCGKNAHKWYFISNK